MSTSLVSLIGLPLSIDSSTANSRARSCRILAIRYRYLARSDPGIGPQTRSWAVRATATARSTSAGPASATLARGSSVAGLMVGNVAPFIAGPNSPFTNSPYSSAIDTISRDSGAGAYSQPRSVVRLEPADRTASAPRRAAAVPRPESSAKAASCREVPILACRIAAQTGHVAGAARAGQPAATGPQQHPRPGDVARNRTARSPGSIRGPMMPLYSGMRGPL